MYNCVQLKKFNEMKNGTQMMMMDANTDWIRQIWVNIVHANTHDTFNKQQ